MKILAIDPGFDRVGWAIGEKKHGKSVQVIDFGLIQTDKKEKHYQRYKQIYTELIQITKKEQPEILALEKLFFQKNQKTVMGVSEARGIIMSVGLAFNLKLIEFTPPQIKQAVTGFGRAEKSAVKKMVQMELKLPINEKIIDDTIDALALLITTATTVS